MEKLHKMFLGQKALQSSFLPCAKWVCCFLLVFAGVVPPLYASSATVASVQQQDKKVSGTVTDENGEPLIGVTLAIKGQARGTVTDINGKYALNVSNSDVLVVSYVGYKRQYVTYRGEASLNIKMAPDAKEMNEVVVIGYGSQRAKDVTGSVATVDMSKSEALPVATLTEALTGQIPGLAVSAGTSRPGAQDASLSIRQQFGYSKDGSNTVPLIIIDDVIQVDPTNGQSTMDQFNMLNPSEIESITVLRDASAAVYGSRGAQGAIIVKTKKGKIGAPKVTYSGKFETQDAVSVVKNMNTYQYGLYANSLMRNAIGSTITTDNYFSDAELDQMKSLNYNWLDKAWSKAQTMQHTLNVSGGTENATYFAGGSYYNQGANLANQNYNRWNFRAGSDIKVMSHLRLNASVSANSGKQVKIFTKASNNISDGSYGSSGSGESGDYLLLRQMPGYIPWSYNVDGTEYYVSPSLGPKNIAGTANTANSIAAWNYFSMINSGCYQTSQQNNYTANFSLNYEVPWVKGLSVKASYARTYETNQTEQDALPYQLALAKNTNKANLHLYSDQTTWTVYTNNKNSRVDYNSWFSNYEQMNGYINYDRTFGLHHVAAMALVERSTNDYRTNFYEWDTPLANAYQGSSSSAGTLSSNSYTNRTKMGTLSYVGRFDYSYAGKYIAQFTIRSDASTKFAPAKYWGVFPSLSFGWIASEESWFKKKIRWMDYLKVRASVGMTGKDNVKPDAWKQTYTYASNKGLGFGTSNGGLLTSSLTANASPNSQMTWDNDLKSNLGFDMNFLNNRLSIKLDGYFDHNYNMLVTMASAGGVPISTGGAFAEQNYAIVNAWGTEISINWKDKIGPVDYNIGLISSWGNNRVIKYPSTAAVYPSDMPAHMAGYSDIRPVYGFKVWKGNSGHDGVLRTQSDIDSYWKYLTDLATKAGTTPSYLGITSKSAIYPGMLAYQDLHGTTATSDPNGQVATSQDYAELVHKNTSYGFTTNLGASWKGLKWTAQIATSWGGYASIDNVKQGTSSSVIIWNHESYWADMFDATTNANGKYPNAYYSSQNNYNSDFWQVSSFRCYVKSMGLAYTLPKKISQKLYLDNCSFSLTGNNLWDFYNPYPNHYRNMYDNSTKNYPTLRTFALGVNVSF
ncbi:MAG: SusC/RagA family TonB-linked outer membrane protein [Bacteroidetes bacterium]|nr:SusC/RagA family TonB-linked outer membrane protein [Bacteroidota bacterium]